MLLAVLKKAVIQRGSNGIILAFIYSEDSPLWHRLPKIHSPSSRVRTVTQSNGQLGLFNLIFLFPEKGHAYSWPLIKLYNLCKHVNY